MTKKKQNTNSFQLKGEHDLVVYCHQIASVATKENGPYFLITSRDNLLNMESTLILSRRFEKDSKELIEKRLQMNLNYTERDVEKLAQMLQHVPMALQQAIDYINEQQLEASISGRRYDIQDYFDKFVIERDGLPNDLKNNRETTFVTTSLALKAIGKYEGIGANALKILPYLAYLYVSVDNIDPRMFHSLFANNYSESEKGFRLLAKYSLISNSANESTLFQIHPAVQRSVQIIFKEHEKENLELAMEVIDPTLHQLYVYNEEEYEGCLDACTPGQLHLYGNLKKYIERDVHLYQKYSRFYDDLDMLALCETVRKVSIKKKKDRVDE